MKISKVHPDINPYTRPGYCIIEHSGLLIHWTGTPRATAENIADAFDRNILNQVHASANYIVGIDGEILEYVPPEEVSYQGGALNKKYYTPAAKRLWYDREPYLDIGNARVPVHHPYFFLIGVEVCHEDIAGQFSQSAIQALRELAVHLWKWQSMGDPMTHNHRHTDMTQKGIRGLVDKNGDPELPCPRWWVEHPMAWERWQLSVKEDLCRELDELQGRGQELEE